MLDGIHSIIDNNISYLQMDEMDLLVLDELTNDEEILAYCELCCAADASDHLRWKRLDIDDTLTDDECIQQFRFNKEDLFLLKTLLQLPDKLVGSNASTCTGMEGLCILLRRLAYPNRLTDLVPIFGLHPTHLSVMFNLVLEHVHSNFQHLISDLDQPWLEEGQVRRYARVTQNAGLPISNCWGFIDGTVMPICRPSQNQREVYNGHRRTHALKCQSVVLPNGLIANLFGPMEGRRHDAALLAESGLLAGIRFHSATNKPLCLYGDSAYPLSPYLMCPYKNSVLTDEQQAFNTGVSSGREAVEWGFGKIVQLFAFVDFRKNQKLYLQPVGKYYRVATLLTNCHTCLYGSQVSTYFGMNPPHITDYLVAQNQRR